MVHIDERRLEKAEEIYYKSPGMPARTRAELMQEELKAQKGVT